MKRHSLCLCNMVLKPTGASLIIGGCFGPDTTDSVIVEKRHYKRGDWRGRFHCGNVYSFVAFGRGRNAYAYVSARNTNTATYTSRPSLSTVQYSTERGQGRSERESAQSGSLCFLFFLLQQSAFGIVMMDEGFMYT